MDRLRAPGCPRAGRPSVWLADALAGLGRRWCVADEPRIDAASVRRLYPSGVRNSQAESLRALMTSGEFRRLDVIRSTGR